MERFSIGEAVTYGWNAFKNNAVLLIVALLIYWVPTAVLSGIGSFLSENENHVAAAFFNIASSAVSMILGMGLINIILKLIDGEATDFNDMFTCLPRFFRYLGLSIIYALIVLGGLLLLIVPGIIWAIKYHFAFYRVVDANESIMDSLRMSSEITKGEILNLFLFNIVLLGIGLLGLLACCVGFIVAAPVTMISHIYVYRKLLGVTPTAQPIAQQPII